MSEEEIINGVKGMLEAGGTINPGFDYGEDKLLQDLLDLYTKEKETSNFLQSQLDIANAKIFELKKSENFIANINKYYDEKPLIF